MNSFDAVRRKHRLKWRKTEKDYAKDVNGRTQTGSGRYTHCDVISATKVIESKETDGKSIGVTVEWLEKLDQAVKCRGKIPTLCLKFHRKKGCQDYLILPYEKWIHLILKEPLC